MRLKRKQNPNKFPKYEIIQRNIFRMQLYHKNNDIEIVKDDYQPWENYTDGTEEKIILYYHPLQFLPIRRLTIGLAFSLDDKDFDDVTNVNESFATMKKFILDNKKL